MRQALTFLGIAVSAALLVRSLRRARRPMIVREFFDAVRHVLQIAAAVAVVVITGVHASTPLLAGSLVAGLGFGFVAGSSLVLEARELRIYAARSVIGAAIWGVGLVVAQCAGLAARTGLFRIGQAVSWFGVATAIGTFLGRRRPLQRARAALPKAVGVAALLLVAGAVAMDAATKPPTAAASPTPGYWQLTATQQDDMTTTVFTSVSHLPGAIEATVDIEGFGSSFSASYPRLPVELAPGQPLSIPIEVSANASGIIQRYTSLTVIQLTADGWTGAEVGVEANCIDPIGDAPVSCTPPVTNSGTFVYDVPAVTPDATFIVGIGLLNCECAIYGIYSAPAIVADSVAPVVPLPDDSSNSDVSADADAANAADDETITDDEALTTSAAVVLISVLIGLVDLAEEKRGAPGPLRRPDPPNPQTADAVADQAIRFAQDATGPLVNYDAVYDQIRELQNRVKSGNARPGDMEMLKALRNALWAIGQAERDGTLSAAARDAALLAALEGVLGVEMEFGKAAAGTFGPTSAAIYAGFVESVANRDKGAAAALGHGAVGGVAAWVGAPSGTAVTELRTTWTIMRAGGSGAAQNAAEDLGHQLVDAGGDPSRIDLGRTATDSVVGFVTGAGGHMVHPGVPSELPPPIGARTPNLEVPRVPTPDHVPDIDVPEPMSPAPISMESWPRDASGRILDPGGNHLFTHTPEGLQAPDGAAVSRVITDGSGRPIGYETSDGVQTISFARQPDPGDVPTVHGEVAVDPGDPGVTRQ